MIRIQVDLVSARGSAHNKPLGRASITNTGTGTPARGNYMVMVNRGGRGKLRLGRVDGFPRKSKSAWELLRRALNSLHEQGQLP